MSTGENYRSATGSFGLAWQAEIRAAGCVCFICGRPVWTSMVKSEPNLVKATRILHPKTREHLGIGCGQCSKYLPGYLSSSVNRREAFERTARYVIARRARYKAVALARQAIAQTRAAQSQPQSPETPVE